MGSVMRMSLRRSNQEEAARLRALKSRSSRPSSRPWSRAKKKLARIIRIETSTLVAYPLTSGRQPGPSRWNGAFSFIGLPFVLLHSLSHLLITAVSLECGYTASSIRERIYTGSHGYGILLYTGTPDAEGTMGGLVEAGRHLARHFRNAIDLGRLCSNDPVCAQHSPENQHECRFLHGAACHGCLLIAETSCEQHNDYLDRALLVSTVDGNGAEFFDGNL
jgi:hypothetical protein